MKKKNLIFFLTGLAIIWGFLSFFTISWDLPSKYTPETDGITPNLNFSAKEMMKADTYKYSETDETKMRLMTQHF